MSDEEAWSEREEAEQGEGIFFEDEDVDFYYTAASGKTRAQWVIDGLEVVIRSHTKACDCNLCHNYVMLQEHQEELEDGEVREWIINMRRFMGDEFGGEWMGEFNG